MISLLEIYVDIYSFEIVLESVAMQAIITHGCVLVLFLLLDRFMCSMTVCNSLDFKVYQVCLV